MQVTKDNVVYFHYSLLDDKGAVVETSRDQSAMAFIVGKKQIVPGLEQAMLGRSAGDKFQVKIKPEQGYGVWDEAKVYDIEASVFAQMADFEVGFMCHVTSPEGEQQLVTVMEITPELITVDANHAYAGLDLKFSVEITEVRKASNVELQSSSVA
ncbi:MAG: peptidylprolyl isomerase [Pseudomonadales bacterium]|nr:peptidylprolyl isomerase [Pseudomonadales bacterium]NRA15342.1 peptidylprolyl isomerase [Oceanospirillaceae bacterium]